MDEPHQIECPQCGFKGKTRTAPADGASVRCVKCGESFVFRAPTVPSVFKPIAEPTVPVSPDWVEAKSLKAIDARMRKLERNNRILSVACILAGAVGAAGLAFPSTEKTKAAVSPKMTTAERVVCGEVVTSSLKLMDSNGDLIAQLGASDAVPHHGILSLHRVGEKTRTVVSPGAVIITDAADAPRFLMVVDDKIPGGKGTLLQMFDAGGRNRVCLTGTREDAVISVADGRGNVRAAIGVRDVELNGVKRDRPFIDYAELEDGRASHLLP